MEELKSPGRLPKRRRKKLNMNVDSNVKHKVEIMAMFNRSSLTATVEGILNAFWDCYKDEFVEFERKITAKKIARRRYR